MKFKTACLDRQVGEGAVKCLSLGQTERHNHGALKSLDHTSDKLDNETNNFDKYDIFS